MSSLESPSVDNEKMPSRKQTNSNIIHTSDTYMVSEADAIESHFIVIHYHQFAKNGNKIM